MSVSDRPILIKKVKKVSGGGHHGGAWKVAYADFVTAMMAFFLLMWLINTTDPEQKKGIAEYFAPASVSETTSGSGGIGADIRGDHWLIDDVELYQVINLGGGYSYRNQYVMFADARAGVLITALEQINSITAARSVTLQVRMKGELLHEEVVTTAAPSAATGVHRNPNMYSTQYRLGLATDTVNPMWALFGYSNFWQGLVQYFGFTGAHIGYVVLPYQEGEYFGGYREPFATPGPMAIVADYCSVTPAR